MLELKIEHSDPYNHMDYNCHNLQYVAILTLSEFIHDNTKSIEAKEQCIILKTPGQPDFHPHCLTNGSRNVAF